MKGDYQSLPCPHAGQFIGRRKLHGGLWTQVFVRQLKGCQITNFPVVGRPKRLPELLTVSLTPKGNV